MTEKTESMAAKVSEPNPSDARAGLLYGLAIVVMVAGAIFAFGILPRWFRPSEGALAGKGAPDFELELVANPPQVGKRTLGLNDYKGQAVILDFWATWCGPCQAQSPVLDRLAHRYEGKGVAVLGVNTSDAPGAAASWARKHQISYPIVVDDEGVASRLYGVNNLPTLIILSREGKIAAVREGFTDASELESLLKRVL